MFGNRLIKSNNAGAACTTDTVQILDGVPLESIATYQLNNATTSIPNNTYPGTENAITYSTGKFGQAAEFNGSTSHIDFTSPIPNTNTAASFSCWFNMSTLHTSGYKNLIGAGNMTSGTGILAVLLRYASAGNYYIEPTRAFGSYTYYTATSNYSTVALSANTWYNVVYTYETSKQAKIYLNGVLVSTTSLTTTSGPVTNSGVLALGQYRDSVSASNWNGSIDQVRIFDTTLSAGAVTSLYNETVATASNSYINVPSCVAYYKMSDATDETGSYDGTSTNVNFNVAGKFGNAGDFKTSQGNMVTPVGIYSNSFSGHSVSFWMKSGGTNYETPFYTRTSSAAAGWHIRTSTGGNGINWGWQNSSGGVVFASGEESFTFTDGWHHVVAIWDGTTSTNGAKLYIDGSLFDELTSNATLASQNFTLGATLGADRQSSGRSILGLDQVRIFDRAITANEVTTLYNEVECIPTIVPTENFGTELYSFANPASVTFDFAPDLFWIKSRGGSYSHLLFDSVRGIDQPNDYYLQSNSTAAEVRTVDRFTLSNGGKTMTIPQGSNSINSTAGSPYVVWGWKAGGAPTATNSAGAGNVPTAGSVKIDGADSTTALAGTIAATSISANTAAGFSIVEYEGAGSGDQTVGHGLSSAPELVIIKNLPDSQNWIIWHKDFNSSEYLQFTTASKQTFTDIWGGTPSISEIYVGSDRFNSVSAVGDDYIAYCFHSVDGMSRIGSYVGTKVSGTPNIVTGFRPAFIIIKRTDTSGYDWNIFDNKRDTTNPNEKYLEPNTSNTEATGRGINFNSNGFSIYGTSDSVNANGGSYIFMAFAEENVQPEPELANSFNTVLYTGNGGTQTIGGVFEGGGSFNGSSSKIDLPNLGLGGGSERSVSFWVNPSVTARGLVFCSGTGSDGQAFTIDVSSVNKIRASYYNRDFETVGTAPNNTWSNIVVTYNGGVVQTASNTKVYINGTLQTLTSTGGTYTGVANTSDSNYSLGYRRYTNSLYLNGKIDQVRIFNTALTAAQVTELYEETDADSHTLDFPSGAGSVALYELNGNANDTGGTYNGAASNVTWLNNGVGFQPDLCWIKNRDASVNHKLLDSIRFDGTNYEVLESNTTAADAATTQFSSFDLNGFTLGGGASAYNGSGTDYVAWCWKASNDSTINNEGSITSVVSANPAAGFSVVKYSGNSTTGATIGHGLSAAIDLLIVKNLTDGAQNWRVQASPLGGTKGASLNTSDEFTTASYWNNTDATDTVFTVDNSAKVNETGDDYIAYAFHNVDSYQKVGSYQGNTSTLPSVDLGFSPRFVMIKSSTSSTNWVMFDNVRPPDPATQNNYILNANLPNQEAISAGNVLNFTSTGFDVEAGGSALNSNGETYIYLAIA